jgi:hypothetical protein
MSNPQYPRPLEWATVEDLFHELTARFPGVVLAVHEPERTGRNTIDVRWDGGPAIAVGLCEVARVRVLHAFDDAREDEGDV